jgi:hypothetical protein
LDKVKESAQAIIKLQEMKTTVLFFQLLGMKLTDPEQLLTFEVKSQDVYSDHFDIHFPSRDVQLEIVNPLLLTDIDSFLYDISQ